MISHIVLCQLRDGVTSDEIDGMMRKTRTQLLKIPEVKSIRCGRRIESPREWGFFVSLEFESMERLASFRANPLSTRYRDEILGPFIIAFSELNYELDPGKDVRFS